jgi:hypothetical protein
MTRKSRARRRQEALYRFLVIAPLLPPHLSPKERGALMDGILSDPPRPPDGSAPPSLSKRTIQRWLQTYREAESDRLEALEWKVRSDHGKSRAIPQELIAQATTLRESSPGFSLKELLKRIDHPKREKAARRTLARAFLEAGYDRRDKRRRIAARHTGPKTGVSWDLATWEADFPNQLWQVDSTPSIWLAAGAHREQPVRLQLVNIIDDHSRLVVGGGFVEQLRVTELLSFLAPAIGKHGCPGGLFVDKATIHRSTILVGGLARLGGEVIFGTAGHAPGHGKIERLHQKAESTLIEDLRRSPVDTAEQATRCHQLWRECEAEEVHTTTGETPRQRWERILGNARIPSAEELTWAFRGELGRQVNELGEIKLNGRVYEAPPSHRRRERYNVTVRFDLLDTSTIWIEDEDGTHHACPLYRTRSHTERRRPRKDATTPPGISYRSLFEEEHRDDTTKED